MSYFFLQKQNSLMVMTLKNNHYKFSCLQRTNDYSL